MSVASMIKIGALVLWGAVVVALTPHIIVSFSWSEAGLALALIFITYGALWLFIGDGEE